MKNLITYPPHRNSPGPQSRFNHLIDLAPTQALIAALAAAFEHVFKTGCDYAELHRLSREKAKQVRLLEKSQWHNFKTGLKWAMLRRRAWRETVLADLGGEQALQKWEARTAKADERAAEIRSAPYVPPAYKRPKLASLRLGFLDVPLPQQPRQPKTDETGCFRLAPIPAPRPKRPEGFKAEPLTWQQTEELKEAKVLRARLLFRARYDNPPELDESRIQGLWFKDDQTNTYNIMAPIPLLPGELRGVGMDEAEEVDDEDMPDLSEMIQRLEHPGAERAKLPDFSHDHADENQDNENVKPPP